MVDEDAVLIEALEGARLARARREQAEIDEIVSIARAADVCCLTEDQVDEALTDQIIGERKIQCGAEGTPFISEFLALEIGPILRCSPEAAFDLLATIMNVKHRHPVLWDAFVRGQIRWNHASRVAHECRQLSFEAAAEVDRKCAHSLAQWPVSRVMYHLKAWIVAADPARAARKKTLAEAHHYVDIDTFNAATCHFTGRISAADGAALDHALEEIAKTLPTQQLPAGLNPDDLSDYERRHFDHNKRRSLAMGILARGAFGQDQLPQAELIIRIDGDDPALYAPDGSLSTSGAAQVDRWGELLTSVLPEFLAGSKVTIRPILVPGMLPAVDQHDPPGLMRRAVCERNPVDVFPFGTLRSASCQVDHTVAYDTDGPPGQTHPGNLGPLSILAHRGKTHGNFRLQQLSPGWFHWTTRLGYEYLVGPSGSRLLRAPAVPSWDSGRREPPEIEPDPPPDDPAWDIAPRSEIAARLTTLPALSQTG